MKRWVTPSGSWTVAPSAQEEQELQRFLTALFVRHGLDFREYHPQSIRRRVWNVVGQEGLRSIAELHARMLAEPEFAQRLLLALPVSVTSAFRDPEVWRTFRERVVPLLRGPRELRLWHAGCATGEEVYSMAILLHEEGLLDRARLFATDIDENALRAAARGSVALSRMQANTVNYLGSGGKGSFSDYYSASTKEARWHPWLRARLTFLRHNLATHPSPGEFDVVLCRNVLIYFGTGLQERTRGVLDRSLVKGGFLVLGDHESLPTFSSSASLLPFAPEQAIYRKQAPAAPASAAP